MTATITARSMLELMAKIYKAEGWVRVRGESRVKRAKTVYELTVNHKVSKFVATRKVH